jgi:hypothetical protein
MQALNPTVADYFYTLPQPQREIMLYFHELLTQHFGLKNKMRYKIPFYDKHSWICYLSPKKDGQVEFVFLHGKVLEDKHEVLGQDERKMVRGIMISELADIPEKELKKLIRQALKLDEELKNKR